MCTHHPRGAKDYLKLTELTDSSTIKNGKVVWTAYLTPEEYDFINLMVKGSCMTKEKFFVLASYFYIALNNNLK